MITKNKKFSFFFFLYLTMLIGLFYEENTSGGAAYDFGILSRAVISFSVDFRETFKNFDQFKISHYPYYYIFLSFIYKLSNSLFFVKLVVVHISLFLPFIFYKILQVRFGLKNPYIIYIVGILFLSPYFRTNAIWGLNDNIALIFFSLSILFYLKSINQKKEKNILLYVLLNLIFLVAATYTRQYYATFALFFFYKFSTRFDYKIVLWYFFTGIFLGLPIIYSILFSPNLNYAANFLTENFFNNIILLFTIFAIYLAPIYLRFENIKEVFVFYRKNLILFFACFLSFIILVSFFDYRDLIGGGIIFKIFYKLNLSYLFFLTAFLCILFVFHFCITSYKINFLILFCLFGMFPVEFIFQKYLDPLSFLLIFGLFESNVVKKFMYNLKDNLKYLYLYCLILYMGSFFYYYNIKIF